MRWSGILTNAERNRKGFTKDQVLQPNSDSKSITNPSNKGVVIKLMIICSSYPPPWLSQQAERDLLFPVELPNTSLLQVWFYRFFWGRLTALLGSRLAQVLFSVNRHLLRIEISCLPIRRFLFRWLFEARSNWNLPSRTHLLQQQTPYSAIQEMLKEHMNREAFLNMK